MPWIDIVDPDDDAEADPYLRRQYEAARKRAGRVWNVVSLMSPNPKALAASMDFYRAIVHGPSPLGRARREMLAVVVSATNGCVY